MGGELSGFADHEEAVAEIRCQVRKQFRIYVIVVGVVSLVVGGIIGAMITRGRLPYDAVELTPPAYWEMVRAPEPDDAAFEALATVTPQPLHVYVTGAVANPGVVTVPADSLLADVLEAVGGVTSDADLESVNLAAPLADNQHIIIPKYTTSAPVTATDRPDLPDRADVPASDLVDINMATLAELETLPHIGPAMAQRIVDYREENGPFARKEDLQNVSGIGETRYNDIAPLITANLEP